MAPNLYTLIFLKEIKRKFVRTGLSVPVLLTGIFLMFVLVSSVKMTG